MFPRGSLWLEPEGTPQTNGANVPFYGIFSRKNGEGITINLIFNAIPPEKSKNIEETRTTLLL